MPRVTQKQLEQQGIFNVEKYELEVDEYGTIKGLGKCVRGKGVGAGLIKATPQNLIDELNTQQINTKVLYKKVGTKYKLIKQFAKGRQYPSGHELEGESMPYKYFAEVLETQVEDPASGDTQEDDISDNLMKMTREALDALATEAGIEDPASFKTKALLINEINEKA